MTIHDVNIFVNGRMRKTALLPSTARHLVKRFGSTLDAANAIKVPEHVIYNALPKEADPATEGNENE
jgi:hypothetical protein